MLDTSSIYQDLFAVDTSSIPLNLSRFCFQYLLDLSNWVFYIYLKFNPNHFKFNYLDTSFFSFDPNLYFSPKSFFQSLFQPLSSFNSLISGLNPFFFSFLILFMHLDLGFQAFGKILGFWVFLCEIFGLGVDALFPHAHALHSLAL